MTTKTDITRTYYLTKYALTDGVKTVSGAPFRTEPRHIDLNGYGSYFVLGSDIFETLPEAITAAETCRVKKIASLKKQIAKLEKMTIKVKS